VADASYQGTGAGHDDGPAARQFAALRAHAGRRTRAQKSLRRGPQGRAPFRAFRGHFIQVLRAPQACPGDPGMTAAGAAAGLTGEAATPRAQNS
jgi:hypothetical protein